jgi:hypothetical protein
MPATIRIPQAPIPMRDKANRIKSISIPIARQW